MRRVTEQDVASLGVDYVMWVTDEALRRDCHLIWWRLTSTGTIQPLFWVLPGDPGYESPTKEVPVLRPSHQ